MPVFRLPPDGDLFTRLPHYAFWLGVLIVVSANAVGAQQSAEQAESTDWLRSLAEGGTTEGQIMLLDQATQGSANAQYALGVMYSGGGIPRDMGEARRWYQAAAAQGHIAALESLRFLASDGDGAALYALGLLSRDGLGVPRDPEAARQAFFWGGKEGHILAHFAAADMLLDGLGGEVDELAASARYTQVLLLAQFALNLCTAEENAILEAPKRRATAQFWIGKLYLTGGGGLEQNAVEAARWFAGAANSGLDEAQYELGRLYVQGRGVPRDLSRALAWLEEAAAQGMTHAEKEIERITGPGGRQ